MDSSSPIIQFYANNAPDNRGRKLSEIWQQNYTWLEKTHDYIQWLFPLPEGSRFNPHAPILTTADIELFKSTEQLGLNLEKSFQLMLDFYGLKLEKAQMIIIPSAAFAERQKDWLHWGNHNHFRITRILKSLKLLGLGAYGVLFFNCLEKIFTIERGKITQLTFSYWKAAIES
jgi:hypothetical protein